MSGILSTGSSALLAFQRALGTVGHNVANAATPGYSRQRVDLAARPGQSVGPGYVGQGVDVSALQRLADGLVFARQVDSSGELGRLSQLSTLSDRIDALVSDGATGVSGPWAAFFTAADAVTASPTSNVARTQMLSAGQTLAARFRSLDSQLNTLENEVDTRLQGKVGDANQLATEIARLNGDIATAGSNASPDLLDARAMRIDQLASLVGGTTVAQDDGALNVFTAGGQALVLGNRAMQLSTVADPYQPDRMQLALEGSGGKVQLSASAVTGELGGLLEFRGRVLDPARAELGRMATTFAQSFNAAHGAGVDYNGAPGGDVFAIGGPSLAAHAANAGNATLTASVGDPSALKGNDLVLRFDGSWTATRTDTGAAVPITGSGTAADPLRVDGVDLVVGGAPGVGDRFNLSPTRGSAGTLQVVLADPAKIAAAGPLQSNTDPANLGTATIAATQVTSAAAFGSFAGATIEFIDDTQYTVNGAGPYAYTAGSAIADAAGGWSVALSGQPAAGDRFTLARTPAHSGDNANARALGAMDQKRLLDGGALSLTDGLAGLTARVGTDARHAELGLEAQTAIHGQIAAERESVSGVNLDEEAADMLRFQQAYQAAAQVISTADNMFQTLLSAVRR
ncbi:flagellar hook-associated protein FlgK [Agrilutibacter solisilvae]|uniref:Flagellar hook-associated protein 1 n=1 Tax=Agrilutibacter solisilvae TaxID=2763317 RepID=A0A975AS51_9GAMM|nr:flagellar hook-associated protein FlgK [Lysobacter solisilvae]QSX77620.1 flagellar hook-associated protein FlgK [Lysobacter solisilvae]